MAAALVVVLLHTSEMLPIHLSLPHADLAVDFFFCLSGFVLASAYESRLLNGLRVFSFIRMRLMRLYPMLFLAMIGGGTLLILRAAFTGLMPLKKAIILSISAIFLIPGGLFYGMQIFPTNNPAWSIFFELIANVIYVLCINKLYKKSLLLFIFLNLLGLIYFAHINRGIGSLGFSNLSSYFGGIFRVNYSFFIGVFIFRNKSYFEKFTYFPKFGPYLTILLLASLLFQCKQYEILLNIMIITIIFPVIIGIGSGCVIEKRWKSIVITAGALSYPLYLIHYPILIALWVVFVHFHNGGGVSPIVWASISFLLALICAYFVMIFYEIPVRRWLREREQVDQTRIINANTTS